MTGYTSSLSLQRDSAAAGRIGRALVASTCVHLCAAAVLLPGMPQRPAPAGIPPITARIAAPVETPEVATKAAGSAASGTKRAPSPASEMTYYPAGELDVFPRLLTPLGVEHIGKAAGGATIRAIVKIDDAGAVKGIEVAAPSRQAEEALRATLTAARFTPALREGRPVRSRIVLEFRFAPSDY